jgi:hypothetical protein
MSGELEPYDQSLAEMETEFASYPGEVRQAALEHARGLQLARDEAEPLPDGDDVQFVLVGVQQAGRAILFASSAVTEANFARQTDGFDRVPICPGGPVARVPRISAIVGAKMTSFEQIVGDDYRDALASLIREWDRKTAAARREAGIREIQEKYP